MTVLHFVPYLVGFVWSWAFQKCPNFECPSTFQLPSRLSSCDKLDKDEVDKGEKDSLENVSLLEQGDIEKVKKKKRKSNDLKDNPNAYSTKKTAVAGMMDMTILTRNGSLLNQKMLENQTEPTNYNTFIIFMVGIAIILSVS